MTCPAGISRSGCVGRTALRSLCRGCDGISILFRSTVAVVIRNVEAYTRYEHLDIEPTHTNSLVAGLRFSFRVPSKDCRIFLESPLWHGQETVVFWSPAFRRFFRPDSG